ncbi:MAG: hypothetical protein IV100_29025 [Myxococcales bacterium]|nr:hypothetical protein [Myxococcales bacterium]
MSPASAPRLIRCFLWSCGLAVSASCSEFVDRVPDAGVDTSAACTSTCSTVGLLECSTDAQRRVCVEAASGCLEWQPASACPTGTTCRDAGSCGADGCGTDGLRVCRGAGGYDQCRLEPSGFLGWGGFEACPAGTSCTGDGECVTSEPECPSVGLSRCHSGLVQTCALIDGVLAFGPAKACPDGESCRGDGICGADRCGLGDLRCGDAGLETCVQDAAGFLDYGDGVPCPGDGSVCRDGRCGVDMCPAAGQNDCTPEGLLTECGLTADGFLAWSGGVACTDGELCRDGQCGADQCPAADATECIDGGLRVCEAGGTFLAWSAPAPCQGGVCFNGACVLNQCPGLGASKCADETHVSLCQKQPDGSFAWGPLIPCPGEGSVCRAAGVCGKDSCDAEGLVGCLTEATTRVCTYDGDPFLTWGPGDDCAQGLQCRDGLCGADACAGGPPTCTPSGEIERCELGQDGFFAVVGPEPCPAAGMVCAAQEGGAECAFDGPFSIASGVDQYALAAAPDGGAVVVWNANGALELGRYAGDGLPIAPVVPIGNAGLGARPAVSVPALGPLAGQAVVVWFDPAGSAVRVRVVSTTGVAPAAFALPVKYDLPPSTSLAALGDPSGALALRHEEDGPDGARLFASQVDATSVAYSVEFGQTTGGTFRGLTTAPDGASGFVSAWASGAETSSTLALRRVDLTGGTIDPIRQVDFPEALSSLSICSYGATWLVSAERSFGSAVLGVGIATFDAGVQPIAAQWQTELAGLISPRLICFPDGAFLLGLLPDTGALVGRRVLPSGALVGDTLAFPESDATSLPDGVRLMDGRVLVLGLQGAVLRARFADL